MRLPIAAGCTVTAVVLLVSGQRFAACLALVGLVAVVGRRRCLSAREAPPPTDRSFSVEQRRLIYERDGGRCVYCAMLGTHTPVFYESDLPGRSSPDEFQADHVVAWNRGGATTVDNAVASCEYHNQLKSDMAVDEWLRYLADAAERGDPR